MRPVAIIQARVGSSRLPGKVLLPLAGRPMLWHIVDRVRHTPGLAGVAVATSVDPADDAIHEMCQAAGIVCFRGDQQDVLDRFFHAARELEADPVVRITGDCPFADPALIDRLLQLYATGEYDHVGIATGAGAIFRDGKRFPDGLDAECFSFAALEHAWKSATEDSDREHVTPYIWRVPGRYRLGFVTASADYSHLRWTIDDPVDYTVVSTIYEALWDPDRIFGMDDVLAYLSEQPQLSAINQSLVGREGYETLWNPGDRKEST